MDTGDARGLLWVQAGKGTNTATPPNPLLLVGGETAGLTKGKASNMPAHRYLPAYKSKGKRHYA